MSVSYESIFVETASSAPAWLYSDKESLTSAFESIPVKYHADFLPLSQWKRVNKKDKVDSIVSIYQSAIAALPHIKSSIHSYRIALEYIISKVGHTVVEAARTLCPPQEHVDLMQDDLYDLRALPRLVKIISTLPHSDIAQMQTKLCVSNRQATYSTRCPYTGVAIQNKNLLQLLARRFQRDFCWLYKMHPNQLIDECLFQHLITYHTLPYHNLSARDLTFFMLKQKGYPDVFLAQIEDFRLKRR